MIKSFSCRRTRRLFERGISAGFLKPIKKQAQRKLAMVSFAGDLGDLNLAPGNRLEPLKGKRKGKWSIRINDQYRICFRFKHGNAFDVEITDYH